MMREILVTIVLPIVLTVIANARAAAPEAIPCPMRGLEAIETAQERGYSTRATRREGSGSCIIRGNTAVAAAVSGGEGLTCRFEFFVSEVRNFASGWKRRAVEFRHAPYQRVPGSNDQDPHIAIDVTAAPGQDVLVSMGTLTLEGTDCKNWRDAFTTQ